MSKINSLAWALSWFLVHVWISWKHVGTLRFTDLEHLPWMYNTVDGRNSATVDRISRFSDLRFFLFFEFSQLDLGSGRVSNRQEIAWRFIWTNSQPGKWHMSPFSIIFIFSESFPRSPDRALTRYLLHFDEVGQMSLVSIYSVEPKRCATQNDADLRFFNSNRFECIFVSFSFCSWSFDFAKCRRINPVYRSIDRYAAMSGCSRFIGSRCIKHVRHVSVSGISACQAVGGSRFA